MSWLIRTSFSTPVVLPSRNVPLVFLPYLVLESLTRRSAVIKLVCGIGPVLCIILDGFWPGNVIRIKGSVKGDVPGMRLPLPGIVTLGTLLECFMCPLMVTGFDCKMI